MRIRRQYLQFPKLSRSCRSSRIQRSGDAKTKQDNKYSLYTYLHQRVYRYICHRKYIMCQSLRLHITIRNYIKYFYINIYDIIVNFLYILQIITLLKLRKLNDLGPILLSNEHFTYNLGSEATKQYNNTMGSNEAYQSITNT